MTVTSHTRSAPPSIALARMAHRTAVFRVSGWDAWAEVPRTPCTRKCGCLVCWYYFEAIDALSDEKQVAP